MESPRKASPDELAHHNAAEDKSAFQLFVEGPAQSLSLEEPTDVFSAASILDDVKALIVDRGTERDKPQGERSMLQTVRIFEAMTGITLTEVEGWKFMIALKAARMAGGKFKLDDYMDFVGYGVLMTESAANEQIAPFVRNQ